MKKLNPLSIIILLILIPLGVYWIGFMKNRPSPTRPAITKMAQVNSRQITEKPSSDGTVKLIETSQKDDGGSKYVFTVTNVKTGINTTILETIVDQSTSFIIPDNAWSPDNKQFFLEKVSPAERVYLVFKADGTDYSNGQKFLDVNSYWSKTKYNLSIRTITGWGSHDLLVVYTLKEDGSNGASFWFVTGSRNFLQLSQ